MKIWIKWCRGRIGIVSGILLLSWVSSFAEGAQSDEEMLKQIQELKNIVRQQQVRIEQLEKKVNAAPVFPREAVPVSEIDRRIDERLSVTAPAYRLMDGLSLSVGATTITQGVDHANGDDQLSEKESVTDSTISVDIALNKKFEDYGEAYVYITAGQGAGIEDELKVFSNVNYDVDNDQNVRLAEAWYEHYFKPFSGALGFGKIDATRYIDMNNYANSETTQFIGRMFGNSPVIEFPSNAAGIHFGMSPIDLFDINLVALDADGDWEDTFDSLFISGQVNIKPKLLNREGNYRLYAWNNGANHTKWSDAAKDKENSFGFGSSMDQELTDNLGLFARYGWQDPKVYLNGDSFSLSQSWSIGPQLKGVLWGRAADVLGIGFGQVIPSKQYKRSNSVLARAESHLECYYNLKVNDHLSLSPDVQVIWQPFGKDASRGDDTLIVGGLRGQIDF
ncbi:MAG: carbohydrate porin [Candidatus Omnitrophota bacterium]